MSNQYDVLVIGAGAAGENAADIAARDGLRVAIIERELVGGLCTYWGCIPSKALLRPGDALDEVRRVPGADQAVTGSLDTAAALDRRDAMAAHWHDDSQVEWVESVGVDLIRGHARLAGPRTVDVEASGGETTRYEAARAVVLATGTTAAIPEIPGIEDVGVWDNRDITTAKEAPRRLLVIGGGTTGTEMAQAWKWLGSEEVTILERSDRILSDEEPFVGEEIAASLGRMGVEVLVTANTEKLERVDGDARAQVTVGAETVELTADEILVATGRMPNTTDVGLETVRLEPGEFVEVDDHLVATGVDGGWLYAVGDVNGRALLTHTGKYQARIAGAHINGVDTRAWGDTKAVPRVVFTSPKMAAVGLTEAQAEEKGIDVRTVRYDLGNLAAAPLLGQGLQGTCQLVVDAARHTIVGATFVGPRADELLHAATISVVAEVTLDTLWHAIPSFPTLSEVWLRLLEAYRDQYGARFA